MDMFLNTPMEFKILKFFAETSIVPARQNQLFQGNIFNKPPFSRIAVAMNTNSPFCIYPFWHPQFDLKQVRIFRSGQWIVDFDAVNNYCFYVTPIKAMICQDDICSCPIKHFKDRYVLVFGLI